MPAFLTHAIADSRQACVSVDSEVCGINLAPESGSSAVENSELSTWDRPALRILDAEVRLLCRPGAAPQTASSDDLYFQSQVLFYLADPSGRIRIACGSSATGSNS